MCDELPVTLMTDMLSGLTEHKNYISYHSLQVEVAVMVLVLGNSWKPGLGSPSFPCPSELSSKIMEKKQEHSGPCWPGEYTPWGLFFQRKGKGLSFGLFFLVKGHQPFHFLIALHFIFSPDCKSSRSRGLVS